MHKKKETFIYISHQYNTKHKKEQSHTQNSKFINKNRAHLPFVPIPIYSRKKKNEKKSAKNAVAYECS